MMKMNKGILAILFCVLFLVIVSGCSYEGPYTFRQDPSNISKVEILTIEDETDIKTVTMQDGKLTRKADQADLARLQELKAIFDNNALQEHLAGLKKKEQKTLILLGKYAGIQP